MVGDGDRFRKYPIPLRLVEDLFQFCACKPVSEREFGMIELDLIRNSGCEAAQHQT